VRQVSRDAIDNNVSLYSLECDPGSNLREQLASTIVGQNWGLLSLQSVMMSLEEIFLQLTASDEEGAAS
jgi:hypothetical protein